LKRSHLILGLTSLALLTGLGYFGWRRANYIHDLSSARQAVGSRHGLEFLSRTAAYYPENAEVSFLLGQQLRMVGRSEEAQTQLRKAASLGWPRDRVDRELLLVRVQTEVSETESQLQALLDQNPFDEEVILALSLGWSRALNVRKAEALVNSILDRQANNGLALCIHGRIMVQRGQPHDAFPSLEKACQVGRDRYYYPDARLLLANCLLDLGRFIEALQQFRESLDEEPGNPKVLLGLARCYWFLDRWDEAAEVFGEILRIDPNHLDALSQLAYIHEERGDLTEARRLLERAAKADPTWADLSFRLAKVLSALGETDRADEFQQRAEKMKSHYAKPRSNPFVMKNAYTGEETKSIRGSSGP
jgi:tetratricopeptide (TPR) repeat protein